MSRLQNQLIGCRFFATIGHFVALVLLFSIIENNIQVVGLCSFVLICFAYVVEKVSLWHTVVLK